MNKIVECIHHVFGAPLPLQKLNKKEVTYTCNNRTKNQVPNIAVAMDIIVAQQTINMDSIDQIMERIIDCDITSLMQIYEGQVKRIHENQITIREKIVFEENITYHNNGDLRTAKTTLPFKVLEAFNDNRYEMVSPEGFEPSTY